MNFSAPQLKLVNDFKIDIISDAVFFVVNTIEKIQIEVLRIADFIYAVVADKLRIFNLATALSLMHARTGGPY